MDYLNINTNFLQLASIFIEVVIALIGAKIAAEKGKQFGWGIFLTFTLYVFYDVSRLANLTIISADYLYSVFFLATVTMLVTVWQVYKKK